MKEELHDSPVAPPNRPLTANGRAGPPRWSSRARHDVPLVVGARAISVAGDAAAMIALLLRAHAWGLGPLGVTALLASFGLPIVLLMGVAGRIADRYDSRRILVLGGTLQAGAAAGLAVADDLVATCVLVLLVQSAHAVLQPTWSALVPRVAGEALAGRLIALQQGLAAVATPVGAATGGLLVGLAGDRVAFLANAATFALVAVVAVAVRTRRGGRRDPGRVDPAGAAAGVAPAGVAPASEQGRRGGLALLFGDPVLRPLFVLLIPICVTTEAVNVVEIFLLRDVLAVPAEQVGLLTVALGAGAVAGSAVAGRIDRTPLRVRGVMAAFAAMGVLIAASGMAPSYAVLLVLQAACGAANALSNGLLMALVVDRVPDARRGDANAALNGLARALGTVALIAGGWLGTVIGPRATFVWCGVATVLVVAGVALPRPSRRERSERSPEGVRTPPAHRLER